MVGLGIYHYGARFYSPKLGRFLSPDSIVPGYANPQAFNRYSYVFNNPLKYIDPTGHDPVCGNSYSDPECNGPDPWTPTTPPAPPPHIPLDPGLPQGGGGGGGNNNNNGSNSGVGGSCNGIPDCGLNDEASPILLPYIPLEPGLPQGDTTPALSDSSSTFNMWDAFSAAGDMAQGGLFVMISIYSVYYSCALAGPACAITVPIFYTMAVVGAQHFLNGALSLWQMNDPSVKSTGREVIDIFFPFLKKKR